MVENRDVRVGIIVDDKFRSEVFFGSEDPIIGWESRNFDVKMQSPTMVNSCELDGSFALKTHIKVMAR